MKVGPSAQVVCAIPQAMRERVWVERFGFGETVDRVLFGGVISGVRVVLDSGRAVVVPPAAIYPAGVPDLYNVTALRPRLRLVEQGG